MTKNQTLLPCPFDGAPAKMEYEDPGIDRAPPRYYARCTKCWAHTTPVDTATWSPGKGHQSVPDAEAQAVKLWNTRSAVEPSPDATEPIICDRCGQNIAGRMVHECDGIL